MKSNVRGIIRSRVIRAYNTFRFLKDVSLVTFPPLFHVTCIIISDHPINNGPF